MPREWSQEQIKALKGGVRKGRPNKATQLLDSGILQAWRNLGGVKYLEEIGRTDPPTFCALLAKIIPRHLQVSSQATFRLEVVSGISGEPGELPIHTRDTIEAETVARALPVPIKPSLIIEKPNDSTDLERVPSTERGGTPPKRDHPVT